MLSSLYFLFVFFLGSVAFRIVPAPQLSRSGELLKRRDSILRLMASSQELTERFEIYDRFDRWRYMQKLLDFEVDEGQANEILYALLKSAVEEQLSRGDDDDVDEAFIIPEEKLELIQNVLEQFKEESSIPALGPEFVPGSSEVHVHLENMLPTEDENPDAFKSVWTVLRELHGHEMVKINEKNGEPEWRSVCLVTRVLLQYDFLTEGLR